MWLFIFSRSSMMTFPHNDCVKFINENNYKQNIDRPHRKLKETFWTLYTKMSYVQYLSCYGIGPKVGTILYISFYLIFKMLQHITKYITFNILIVFFSYTTTTSRLGKLFLFKTNVRHNSVSLNHKSNAAGINSYLQNTWHDHKKWVIFQHLKWTHSLLMVKILINAL